MPDRPPFRLLPLVVIVLIALIGISLTNQWHGQNQSLTRFCEDPAATLEQVHRLLTEQHPAGDDFDTRQPYIVASRLVFLMPQQGDESVQAYLLRLQTYLEQHCR